MNQGILPPPEHASGDGPASAESGAEREPGQERTTAQCNPSATSDTTKLSAPGVPEDLLHPFDGGRQATILVIDDDMHNRKLLGALLEPQGYVTLSAASGEEALASIALHAPDLILLDMMLPGMDGVEVARILKADPKTSNIPIIMITASSDRGARLAGLTAGAEEFLNEPFDRMELYVRVRNLLRLKALGDFLKNSSMILEQQVQARTSDLWQFRRAMDAAADAITLVNRTTMRYVEVNATACSLVGYPREELFRLGPAQIAGWSLDEMASLYDRVIAVQGTSIATEHRLQRKDQSHVYVEVRRQAQRSGADWIIVAVLHDITQRKEAEAKISHLNRVNAVLSGINALIVRVRSREELFKEACRIAVRDGQFGLAWIGMIDAASNVLQPCAWEGIDQERAPGLRLKVGDAATGAVSVNAEAIRQKQTIVSNDLANDARVVLRAELVAQGHASLVVLPLIVNGEALGTMTLAAQEKGFFDRAEMRLLEELAGNISFALDHIDQEIKLKRLTRVHSVMSGTNALIVRARDRDELFREACRIAVDAGFLLAWVGICDRDAMRINPVAWQGTGEEYISLMPMELNDQQSLPAAAIRTRRQRVANDMSKSPYPALKEAAQARGFKSMVVLPLIVGDEAIAVLALYSGDIGYFNETEIDLLGELAGNIAFAIDNLNKQARLDYLAYYDVLTGLANLTLFRERLEQSLTDARERSGKLGVVLIDVERFRGINDTLGRQAGDDLLKELSRRMAHYTGAARVARIEADHFAVMVLGIGSAEEVARRIEQRIVEVFEPPFRIGGAELRISVKFGIAMFPIDGSEIDVLLRNAEAALKKAKSSGHRYLFYAQGMNERVAGKLTLENQLRQALEKDEFVLHYQPKVDLGSRAVVSAEALIRWDDPRTGLVAPNQFIPVLEETGLIYQVGRWALRQAIADYLRWHGAGLAVVRIAVNVSPLQLRYRDFVAEVAQVIAIDPRAAAGLELEITESVIMEDVEHSIATLRAIRAMGVTIALDDFGTGFSSLSYLSKLPVDTLKIDRSFVVGMTADPQGLALVSTIINLAHSLKLNVVAEGVETEEQSHLLQLLSCDEMQGFLYSKPVPPETFEERFLGAGISP